MTVFLLSIIVCILCPAVLLLGWMFVGSVLNLIAYTIGAAFFGVIILGCIAMPGLLLLAPLALVIGYFFYITTPKQI